MSDTDKRVWMYRADGESRLFDSPEAVPDGEGWSDTPAANEPAPAKKRVKKAEPEVTSDDDSA